MTETIAIRRETLDDIPIIVKQRRAMFEAMGITDAERLDRQSQAFEPWLRRTMENGRYVGWFAVVQDASGEERCVAGAGLWLFDWIPGPFDPRGLRAYILNVYTEPEFRKRGIARRLVTEAIDYAREQGILLVSLHASDEGRPIYQTLGFEPTKEMRLTLDQQP